MSIKVKTIHYERTFNLGNYENERIAMDVEVNENEDVENCFLELKKQVMELSENKEDNKPFKRVR